MACSVERGNRSVSSIQAADAVAARIEYWRMLVKIIVKTKFGFLNNQMTRSCRLTRSRSTMKRTEPPLIAFYIIFAMEKVWIK